MVMSLDSIEQQAPEDGLHGTASRLRPLPIALLVAGIYTIASVVYIRVSSSIAARLSHSVAEMQAIEQYKGIFFVLVTGLLLFVIAWLLLNALRRRDEELLRNRNVLISSERVAIAGIFASSMAHDVNNILTAIQGNLELLMEYGSPDPTHRTMLADAYQAGERLGQVSRRLMHSARSHTPGQITNLDLVPIIQEAADFAHSHQKVRQRHVSLELPDTCVMPVNAPMVTRSLLNLIINAADATAPGGRIQVVLDVQEKEVVLQVHDDGPGIPGHQLERIFEPFFTSKADGNGLGLLSVRSCAQEHGGRVLYRQSPMGGACFELYLACNSALTPQSA